MALSSMSVWGEEWKGIKLTRLYILLREQFCHPDDPWCTEIIKWNEFRLDCYPSFTYSQPFQENVRCPHRERRRLS